MSNSRSSIRRPPKRPMDEQPSSIQKVDDTTSSVRKRTATGELVWVTQGATQHPAHLLESSSSANRRQPRKCLVQWVSTGDKDWVLARHVQRQLLSRKRPKRTNNNMQQQQQQSLSKGRRGRSVQPMKTDVNSTMTTQANTSAYSVDKLLSCSNASASSTIESLPGAQESQPNRYANHPTGTMHHHHHRDVRTISIPAPRAGHTPSPRDGHSTTIIRRSPSASPQARAAVTSLPPHVHDLVYGEDRPTLYKGTALEGRDQPPTTTSISTIIFWVLEQAVIAGILYAMVQWTKT